MKRGAGNARSGCRAFAMAILKQSCSRITAWSASAEPE
ncbi:hypothetical protein 7AX3_15 [uncultured Caudovirales phage]|uniref:Uncharacterized protein n=1 Tax=uncultured Caudovirales phage TaxID=2100421 RepID=A0A2H4J9K7_9CAUD|nr:hypothetical protein 7AX3_15 [uncultured Caudovirales phage]